MTDVLPGSGQSRGAERHPAWVRISHGLVSASLLTLGVTGFVILMAHPRLYWGDAGNDLTPALLELPISRNHQHGGWAERAPISGKAAGPISANRTYDIFNQNGWARSLHFLAGWWLVLPGACYLLAGLAAGHFRAHFWPKAGELAPAVVWRDVADHFRFRVPHPSGGSRYGLLQKCAYALVVFVAAPLIVVTGLAMSPAVTASLPILLSAFGGYQSARTIHFVSFVALVLFVLVHVAMVIRSGFKRQIRSMTIGGLT